MSETEKDDNSKANAVTNMTARSKVMQNWSSSWNTITPMPVMPAEELHRVPSRRNSRSKTSAYNDHSVISVTKKTKEITALLNVKSSAKPIGKRNKSIDKSINNVNNKSSNDESNSNESDIKSENNNNNSDSATIYNNLRKRKSIEMIDEDRMSTKSNNSNNECEQTGNKVLKIDRKSPDINGGTTMNDNNNLDVNDIYESFQSCCIFHYPLTHPLPFPTHSSTFPSISFANKTLKSELQIKAQIAVKKSLLIQSRSKKRKKRYIAQSNSLTFTKPSVKIVEYEGAFKEFVSQKFAPQEKIPFFQDRSCTNCPHSVSQCLDCISVNEKNGVNGYVDSQTCRFYQYRTLIKCDGNLMVYAFAEEGNATPEDTRIWLPWNSASNLDEMTAKFLLTYVSEQFCQIYMEEFAVMGCETITWKKPVKGVRELCDLCSTTIFNTHWVCPVCGYAVCIDCFQLRRDEQLKSAMSGGEKRRIVWRREVRDEYNWLFCSTRERHSLTEFHLALFITKAVFASLNTSLHMTRNRLEIKGKCGLCGDIEESLRTDFKSVIPSVSELKSMYAHIPHQWFCDQRLLVLKEPRNANNINLFQIHWIRGDPVVVENVNDLLDADLWTPNAFNRDFGKQMSRLVNCMNGAIIPKKPMKYFWDGFENMSERIRDQETGEEMLLKLKDWPPNAEFRDKLPKRFHNLMDCLPLPEYTRYDGIRNLSTRLPEFFVRPDLGPKMYCAYGSVKHSDKGTTNLHLDMSDAINVMIYVGMACSEDTTLEDYCRESIEALVVGGCDEEMIERVRQSMTSGRRVGALWHIFPANDANKIRQFLTEIAVERGIRIEVNNDPIHDQCWYLDEALRQRLLHSYGVRGLAIGQCLGDAILIPAGAPHQVRNLNSCIKVAGEFVSPENVSHCLSLTHEFRKLSRRHNNHEDKLQIKNVIYHTVKDAISVLLPSHE